MTVAVPTRERAGSASSISSTDSQVALPSFEHLAPPRERTTAENAETAIPVPGMPDVKLKVDAGPGCGGIAWPAGEVSYRQAVHAVSTDIVSVDRSERPARLALNLTFGLVRSAVYCREQRDVAAKSEK